MKKFIPYILIAWSLLIYIGYNVSSAEAEKKDCSSISEPDDDFYCKQFDWGAFHPDKQSIDELCDASEDYAKNPKHCDIAYELVEKQEKNLKEACEKAGGKMIDGYCDGKSSNKAIDKKSDEMVEKACKNAGLKMKDGMCDTNNEKGEEDSDKFYREYDKIHSEEHPELVIHDGNNEVDSSEEPPVIEDWWSNEVVEPEQEIQDWSNEVSETDNNKVLGGASFTETIEKSEEKVDWGNIEEESSEEEEEEEPEQEEEEEQEEESSSEESEE